MPPNKDGDSGNDPPLRPPRHPPIVHFADNIDSTSHNMPNDKNNENDHKDPKNANDGNVPNQSVDLNNTNDPNDLNLVFWDNDDEHTPVLESPRILKPRSNTESSGRTAVTNSSGGTRNEEAAMTEEELAEIFIDAIRQHHAQKTLEPEDRSIRDDNFKTRLEPYLRPGRVREKALGAALFFYNQVEQDIWENMSQQSLDRLVDILLAGADYSSTEVVTAVVPPSGIPPISSYAETASVVRHDIHVITTDLTNFTANLPDADAEVTGSEDKDGEGHDEPGGQKETVGQAQAITRLGDGITAWTAEFTQWRNSVMDWKADWDVKLEKLKGIIEERLIVPLEQKEKQVSSLLDNLSNLETRLNEKDKQDEERNKREVEMRELMKSMSDGVEGLRREVKELKVDNVDLKTDNTDLKSKMDTVITEQKNVFQKMGIIKEGQEVTESAMVQLMFEIAVSTLIILSMTCSFNANPL